jgi:uncharacterized protein (DUF2225 family)
MKKLLFITLLLLINTVSYAMTVGEEEFVCPIDEHQFKARINYSGTSFGMRLDMKPIGPTPAPWLLPTCPKCGFPLFKNEFSNEEIKKYRFFVTSDAFRQYIGAHPSYFLLAKVKEFDKAPANQIAHSYIQASWQVEERNIEKYKSYLTLALKEYIAFVNNANKKGDDWLTACIMIGELERQLGNFEAALIQFQKLQSETIEKETLQKIIKQEIGLCQEKISIPQQIEQ